MATQAQLESQIAGIDSAITVLNRQLTAANTSPADRNTLAQEIQRLTAQRANLVTQLNALTQASGPQTPTAPTPPSATDINAVPLVPGNYEVRQDSLTGSYVVVETISGQTVASGLTEQEAILFAQDQSVTDEGVTPPVTAEEGGLVEFTEQGETAVSAAEIQARVREAQRQQTIAQQRRQINNGDWRVRLRLAPQSKYLYNAPDPGILKPLAETDGVIFPYTPRIETAYRANYSPYDLTHSNYKGYFYKNSFVDPITITCPFTAQDTAEANYLLAVIHFFRSATKMFYGQDAERGSPPPLVYLTGLGEYQFNEHSCLIQSFNYVLPDNIDYVRAGSPTDVGVNLTTYRNRQSVATSGVFGSINRLAAAFLTKGAIPSPPPPPTLGLNRPTYVPTKMDISITLLPVQSRQQVSNQFSLKNFANGNLLRGGFW